MTDQQNIFDEKLIDIRKKRVKNNFSSFIHDLAISDLKDRLLEIGNECLEILIVGHFAKYWSNNLTIKKTKYVKEKKFLNILPRSQDLIISALHLHSANDPISKLVQMRFGLKTNGIFTRKYKSIRLRSHSRRKCCVSRIKSRNMGKSVGPSHAFGTSARSYLKYV